MTQPFVTASSNAMHRQFSAGASLRLFVLTSMFAVLLTGCSSSPRILRPDERKLIDRSLIERPSGFDVQTYAVGLDQPVSLAFDGDGNVIIAEAGLNDGDPRIYGFTPEGTRFDIYPFEKSIIPFVRKGSRIYGPIGGILLNAGKIYVSHRDENDFGVISALDYKGGVQTIVAGLPAKGEHGVTDMAIDPRSGRLFFGIGSATNSGVVGIDDYQMGWPKKHPDVHDIPYTPDRPLRLRGLRFNSSNPAALWLMPDIAVTGPYQPFGQSSKTTIKGADRNNPKCNSAILSVQPDGGDLRVEAHGIRLPKGLAFNEFGSLYFTNQGMELRGTRPIRDDPDVLARLFPGAYYGGNDFSTDLKPIYGERFQPDKELIQETGYPDVSFLVDHSVSGLVAPDERFAKNAILGVMASQSGASNVEFVPGDGPFKTWTGSAIVALAGDRAPFATSGRKTKGSIGFKLVRVDPEREGQISDFVRNVQDGPSSRLNGTIEQLERPIDIKFGPDGALYILDFGQMEVRDGRAKIKSGSGRIYRMIPSKPAMPTAPRAP